MIRPSKKFFSLIKSMQCLLLRVSPGRFRFGGGKRPNILHASEYLASSEAVTLAD